MKSYLPLIFLFSLCRPAVSLRQDIKVNTYSLALEYQQSIMDSLARDGGAKYSIISDEEIRELYGQEEEEPYRETRLRYPHFTMVFRNFKGYDVDTDDEGRRSLSCCQFSYGDTAEMYLNEDEREN